MEAAQAYPQSDERQLLEKLSDQKWRLNNLYRIIDKSGKEVTFKMNWAQEYLYENMHYLNIILKARQVGVTTFIAVFMLDTTIFNSNQTAGIIAHTRDDGAKIFETKIKFPLGKLPPDLQPSTDIDSKTEYRFENNSSVRVGTSMRSSTQNIMHISEFGKICAKFPERAKEIVTGGLNTIEVGQLGFMESTAEGRGGYFYEYCKIALKNMKSGKKLSPLDWKIFFFPWHKHPEYRMDPEGTVIPASLIEYFDKLQAENGIELDDEQKAWYTRKAELMNADGKDDTEMMMREYPSTPEEAFYVSMVGAYYGKHMTKLRGRGGICSLPHDPGHLVHTAWDLGYDDENAIWFFQIDGPWINVIDYFENQHEGLPYYIGILSEKAREFGYVYGQHFAPHDIDHHEWTTGNERRKTAREMGINFTFIPRIRAEIDGVEKVRKTIPRCRIDESKCEQGINCLDGYKKKYDENKKCFLNHPDHNWASHGSKAFESLAFGVPMITSEQKRNRRPNRPARCGYGG